MRAKSLEESESGQSSKVCTFLLWKGLALSLFTLFKIFATWEMTLQYEYLNSQPAQCKRCRIFLQTATGITVVRNELCVTDSQWVGEPWCSALPKRTKSQGWLTLPYCCLENCFFIFKDTSVIVPRSELCFWIQKNDLWFEKTQQFLLMA